MRFIVVYSDLKTFSFIKRTLLKQPNDLVKISLHFLLMLLSDMDILRLT